jgi:methionyl-tRNA synthetase
MPETPKTYYLTTPIYYVNARPHIGHAYTTIVGDVLARRHRLLGEETFYLTGTDEHGQKIERSAAAAGIPPQQFTDKVSAQFRTLWDRMGITYNDYIRTTEPRHKQGVQQLFRKLYDNGFIYLDSYTGAYCVSDEAFVDAPIGTPCPDCGKLLEEVTEENFFFKLSAFQEKLLNLIESNELLITPDSARNEVLSFVRGNVAGVATEIYNEQPSNKAGNAKSYTVEEVDGKLVKSLSGHFYVPGALKDLSISRSSFSWGIPVPEDIQKAAGATKPHVVYVWLDALANYMTALGYGSADDSLWQKFWPADLHLVGKEITRFHCVYWPAFLMAADIATPKTITANGWLLFDNAKMSKSKGNVVRSETILEAFGRLCPAPLEPTSKVVISTEAQRSGETPVFGSDQQDSVPADEPLQPTPRDRDLFATDVLRYFLLREIPFGQDGSFSFDALVTRYNADLANGYGNLVSRTLNMIQQYFAGAVPAPLFELPGTEAIDTSVVGAAALTFQTKLKSLRDTDFSTFLTEVAAFITIVDGFISAAAPWKLAKDPAKADQLATVLYVSAEAIRWITGTLFPICPTITAKVWQQLGLGDINLAATDGELAHLTWGGLKPGTQLGTLGPIFPRADKGLAQIMIDLENPHPAPEPTATTDPAAAPRTTSLDEPSGTLTVGGSAAHTTGPSIIPSHTEAPASGIFAAQPAVAAPAVSDASPEITIDDFVKVELRIAEVKVCERIPKADKLLRLEVDLGPLGTRQILSGIAEHYTPEEMVGKRIIVITNLAPRKMRGLESHGMLLAASEEGGKPFLATVPEGVPVGTRLK